MYTEKDISLIIPTINRPRDLTITLHALKPFLPRIKEVLVIDQSTNNETENLVRKFNNKKIRYFFSSPPAITIARNLGVQHTAKSSEFIAFIDDDVTLADNYFLAILTIFNTHPEVRGVAAFNLQKELSLREKAEQLLRKLFFLGHLEHNKARMLSSYGNTYPFHLQFPINAEWLPGVNMVYKKSVFQEQQFDEHLLGYTVAEDIDFSYRLFKKSSRALIITPETNVHHRVSSVERTPTETMSYINQVDHLYFHLKHLNTPLNNLVFIWSLTGIALLRTLRLLTFTKNSYFTWKYFLSSLYYCLTHLKEIKAGQLRAFIQGHK